MNQKMIELAEHRAALVAMAAAQREEFSRLVSSWPRPLAAAAQGWETVRNLAGHPAVIAWAAALLFGIGPGRMLRWLQQGWWILGMARTALNAKRSLFGG